MIRSELAATIEISIPCGNCGKEFEEWAAKLVTLDNVICPHCLSLLDLDTKEWAAFRNALKEFSVGKYAPVAQIKKLR